MVPEPEQQSHPDGEQQTDLDALDADVTEESLLEEVSIDGMCGVY